MAQKSVDFEFRSVSIHRMQNQTEIPTLTEAIRNSNMAQIDCLWAILKYKEIGILRKVKCMAEVFGPQFDLEQALRECPVDDKGRIVDYRTRHLIHDVLLECSRRK
jgi:hypothetical protein